MADFDVIQRVEDEDSLSSVEESCVQVCEPVVIRGTGHITLFGLNNQFSAAFPHSLLGRLAPEEFEGSVGRINAVLRKSLPVSLRWLLCGCCFCLCTCGCSLWPVICLSKRTRHCLQKTLGLENASLYNKLGLHWRLARQRCDNGSLMEYVLVIETIPKKDIFRPDWRRRLSTSLLTSFLATYLLLLSSLSPDYFLFSSYFLRLPSLLLTA